VLVLEKGRRLQAKDFPKTNWNFKRWLWMPWVGFRGLFKMTFLPHITALSGVGVGGGSLVYANTLPIPKDGYFQSPSWAHLRDDWKSELSPHYATARKMLGATPFPHDTYPDTIMRAVAKDMGREESFEKATVAVYFGKPGVTVPDPFFGGEGPERTGCTLCGGCMIGCREGAKNTLDKNYLYLAEKKGAVVQPDAEVVDVLPVHDGAAGGPKPRAPGEPREGGGYIITTREGARLFGRETKTYRAANVVFSGGVLGTVKLLLQLKKKGSLPNLSERLGDFVRTNSEVLLGVISKRRDIRMSDGIAITSILHTDAHSHLEPVRYPDGSGAFRTMMTPHAPGSNVVVRVLAMLLTMLRHPWEALRAYFVPNWARYTMILLYMRTIDGHLRMRLGRGLRTGLLEGVTTQIGDGPAPSVAIPEASNLAERVAEKVDGFPGSLLTETLLGVPTTAHILGGCCMGRSAEDGVIDHRHRVFGHDGLYVVDGSAISANLGVNPSLSICALAERAMTFIPAKAAAPAEAA
jgi:cholesterol oxidase